MLKHELCAVDGVSGTCEGGTQTDSPHRINDRFLALSFYCHDFVVIKSVLLMDVCILSLEPGFIVSSLTRSMEICVVLSVLFLLSGKRSCDLPIPRPNRPVT